MINIKKIFVALFITLLIPVSNCFALSIDTASFDETKNELSISGESEYEDVMVSLFSEDNLLTFKTTTSIDGKYNDKIYISFDKDQKIIVKVGDINSKNYKIKEIDVKASNVPDFVNTITDDQGNSLTILDDLKHFDKENYLRVNFVFKEDLDEQELMLYNYVERQLGERFKLIGFMVVEVIDDMYDRVNLANMVNGYKLVINKSEEEFNLYNQPYAIPVDGNGEVSLDSRKTGSYDNGFVFYLDGAGMFALVDDLSNGYYFLENTEDQTYDIYLDNTITYRINAPFSKFVGVYVDDILVDAKNYTKVEGSTIVTFKSSFLKTLKAGTHSVRFEFTDGFAIGSLKVISTEPNPKTSDNLIKYIVVLIASIITLGAMSFVYIKKIRNKSN